jgi:LEA14-like dessication related protein
LRKLLKYSFSQYLFYNGYPGGFRNWHRTKGRSIRRFAAGIALLGLLFMLSSCLGWLIERPTFTLKAITVQPVSLQEMHLLLGVEVRNPNNYDLELKSLDFKLHLNDRMLGTGVLQQELLIPKARTSEISVPIRVGYADIGDCLKSVITGREVRYKLEGQARIKAGLGSATIPFTKEGSINQKDQ